MSRILSLEIPFNQSWSQKFRCSRYSFFIYLALKHFDSNFYLQIDPHWKQNEVVKSFHYLLFCLYPQSFQFMRGFKSHKRSSRLAILGYASQPWVKRVYGFLHSKIGGPHWWDKWIARVTNESNLKTEYWGFCA
jgi:hypothetical protein